jgi:hypothetical protein
MTPDAETNNGVLFAADMSVLEPSYGALFAPDAGSASRPIGFGQVELSARRNEIIDEVRRNTFPRKVPLRGKVALRSNDG